MRPRALMLFLIALVLAGGTALLLRSWMAHRSAEVAAAPVPPPPLPQKSVLVAKAAIGRGQKLQPTDLVWHPWPEAGVDQAYIQQGSKPIEAFAGRVAREPLVAGEPITEAKTIEPGDGGVLAAVLRPGMRAVSVALNPTSDVSGFIFPGDQVDVVMTEAQTPPAENSDDHAQQHKAAETVLHNIRVLGIDQKLDNKNGEVVPAKMATLEVTPKQSEILALAGEMGKLALTLRSLVASPSGQLASDSPDDGAAHSYTLDNEVSPLLRKPTHNARAPTILRGNSKQG